jgi:hypothetical protein
VAGRLDSTDVRELVPGDVPALRAVAAHLRSLSGTFGRTAAGLARIDVGGWTGTAADAFRSRFGGEPARWAVAAEAFGRAAAAWESHARAVERAQGRAAQAVALLGSGGEPVDRAREILADARRGRDEVAAAAARVLADAAALAPDPPTGWDRVGADVADGLTSVGTEGAQFLGGLGEGTVALVRFVSSVNPFDQRNSGHPVRYADAVSTAAAGTVIGALHPIRTVGEILGAGWGSDPAAARGRLVPGVLAAVAAGGLGRAALGAAKRATPATVPRGFTGAEEFTRFGGRLHTGLSDAGFPGTRAVLQGSAVTGRSFGSGAEFDVGRTSDYDVALAGPAIFDAATAAGIGLRSAGTRTGPLSAVEVESLGLTAVRGELSAMAGREVNFMIYRDIDQAVSRGPSTGVPGS